MTFIGQYYSMACASSDSVHSPPVLPQGILRNEFLALTMRKLGARLVSATLSCSFYPICLSFSEALHPKSLGNEAATPSMKPSILIHLRDASLQPHHQISVTRLGTSCEPHSQRINRWARNFACRHGRHTKALRLWALRGCGVRDGTLRDMHCVNLWGCH